MSNAAFDTLAALRDLEAAGIDSKHAEAIVSIHRRAAEDIATKGDLRELEQRITIRLGSLTIAIGGLVVALVKLLP